MHTDRKLLPKQSWQYWFYPASEWHDNRDTIVIGCYVKGLERCLSHEVFPLSDLPNDFVDAQDLEAILANLLDRSTMFRFEKLPYHRVGAHSVAANLI